MEQLPPKAPIPMSHNWPTFPFQTAPLTLPASVASAHSSWVDEFLDFSAMRRNTNRRTVSDPIAFVEAPPNFTDEAANSNGFERLDQEQLGSMFSDEVGGPEHLTGSPSNPSTPSDQHSENDDKKCPLEHHTVRLKNEPGEVESSCGAAAEAPAAAISSENASGESVVDPKRIKRILANRQSAQRSRVRKLHYISELERSVTTLQTEVSALSPRVAFLDHQRLLLNVDNSSLKQRIAALAQDKLFKDAHQESLKKEIERLRRIYHEQNMNKINNDGTVTASVCAPPTAAALHPPIFHKSERTERD